MKDKYIGFDIDSNKTVAVVATARKLLTIMRAMLLTGELFNEQMLSASKDADPAEA